MKVDQLISNGYITCDKCRSPVAVEKTCWQISNTLRVRFYCMNCWLRWTALIRAGKA